MLLRAQAPQALFSISDGPRGTRQTLRLMAQLVREATRNTPAIRNRAADLVAFVPGQGFREQARLLFQFVRDQIRYLGDVNGVETIQAPDVTLSLGYGDCDDKATLLAALLESIGHPARFVAVGFGAPGEFDHVFLETKIGSDWIPMETTVDDAPMGWAVTDEQTPNARMRESI